LRLRAEPTAAIDSVCAGSIPLQEAAKSLFLIAGPTRTAAFFQAVHDVVLARRDQKGSSARRRTQTQELLVGNRHLPDQELAPHSVGDLVDLQHVAVVLDRLLGSGLELRRVEFAMNDQQAPVLLRAARFRR